MSPDIYPLLRIPLKGDREITVGPSAGRTIVGVVRWVVFGLLVAFGHLPPWSRVVEALSLPWQ